MATLSDVTKDFAARAAIRYLKSHSKPVSFPTPQKGDNKQHILQSDILRTKKTFTWGFENAHKSQVLTPRPRLFETVAACNAALTSPRCYGPGRCQPGGHSCLAAHLGGPQTRVPSPVHGPTSKREGQGFAPTTASLPNANTVFGEGRKQGWISRKRKATAGLGSTLAAEHRGGGDIFPGVVAPCPPVAGTLPTGCRRADNVTF